MPSSTQTLLGTVEHLNSAVVIDQQHDGMGRWNDVATDDRVQSSSIRRIIRPRKPKAGSHSRTSAGISIHPQVSDVIYTLLRNAGTDGVADAFPAVTQFERTLLRDQLEAAGQRSLEPFHL